MSAQVGGAVHLPPPGRGDAQQLELARRAREQQTSLALEDAGIGSCARSFEGAQATMFVLMRPSTFLSLSTPLRSPRPSLAWLTAQIAADQALCPASLRVWLPPSPAAAPGVVAHDGRHRMTALLATTRRSIPYARAWGVYSSARR